MSQFATMLTPLRIAIVFSFLALGWRLVHISEWPFPYAPTVQYESALAARAIWLTLDPAQRTPERAVWYTEVGFKHVVSPPILPALVAATYCISGEEIPWISKLYASLFWIAASWFIYFAAIRQTGNHWAALVALTWFVWTPSGLLLSRSFQTDSLLVCGFAVAVWHLSRLRTALRWRETLGTGALCGLCAFAKPGILFAPLAAGFASIVLASHSTDRFITKLLHIAAFTIVMVIPSIIYVAFVLSGRGGELMTSLLLEGWFYRGVEMMIVRIVGYPALALGLLGLWFATQSGRPLLLGLFTGYLGYICIFTYHCATHEYYHAPLLVMTALGFGWTASRVLTHLERLAADRPATRRPLQVLAVLGLLGFLWFTRLPYLGPWRYSSVMRSALATLDANQASRDARYRAALEVVGPGAKVVAVTEDYGYPLEYRTSLRVFFWPRSHDIPIMVRAGQLPLAFDPDTYLAARIAEGCTFAVVTDFPELARQPALQAALRQRGRLIVEREDLHVYDLRTNNSGETKSPR